MDLGEDSNTDTEPLDPNLATLALGHGECTTNLSVCVSGSEKTPTSAKVLLQQTRADPSLYQRISPGTKKPIFAPMPAESSTDERSDVPDTEEEEMAVSDSQMVSDSVSQASSVACDSQSEESTSLLATTKMSSCTENNQDSGVIETSEPHSSEEALLSGSGIQSENREMTPSEHSVVKEDINMKAESETESEEQEQKEQETEEEEEDDDEATLVESVLETEAQVKDGESPSSTDQNVSSTGQVLDTASLVLEQMEDTESVQTIPEEAEEMDNDNEDISAEIINSMETGSEVASVSSSTEPEVSTSSQVGAAASRIPVATARHSATTEARRQSVEPTTEAADSTSQPQQVRLSNVLGVSVH